MAKENNLQELYKHVGNGMFHTIPEEWSQASIEAYYIDGVLRCVGQYISRFNSKSYEFDVHERIHADFETIREISFAEGEEWNTAEFKLERDGQFQLNFSIDHAIHDSIASQSGNQ